MINTAVVINEKEYLNNLLKYFSLSLRDIKKYLKLSDAELYERDIGVSRDELKKCKVKVLNYMNCKNINSIAKKFEYFLSYEEAISPYLIECNKIIKQYKKQA